MVFCVKKSLLLTKRQAISFSGPVRFFHKGLLRNEARKKEFSLLGRNCLILFVLFAQLTIYF